MPSSPAALASAKPAADSAWMGALAFLALLLLLLGAVTGYYSRKWTPRSPSCLLSKDRVL